ncbi:MAG: T9SS C-terminal target domain-containing protein [Verrucomicrobiae bacterium]|nr:T9SS C-terminal target domain-containing protein [Verrucomicrobiae bacterium]
MRKRLSFRLGLTLMAGGLTLGLSAPAATIEVTTPLPRGEVRWTRDNVYVLNGLVHALSGTELHIEAGTVIKGRDLGTDAMQRGGLVITRGAKIFAEGTPTQPIIMTAEADELNGNLDIYDRGLWGGLVVLGRTVLNGAADTTGNVAVPVYDVYEGLPDVQIEGEFVHRFGGTDDEDNSGVIRYVSIRHGGARIEQNKEINGLTMGAVGRGTTIEFVEAYAIADDGFEWFGGTVNTRYLVSAFNDDDSFDADQGYSGKNQFWFFIQSPDAQNYGFELNGEVSGTTGDTPRRPYSTFQAYNVTGIGAGAENPAVGEDNDVFRIREFSTPGIYNGIFTDFSRRGVRIDEKSGQFLTDGTLQLTHNLWWGFPGGNTVENLAVDERARVLFTESGRMNRIEDPRLRGISREADGGLDPRPATGSPALDPANVKAVPDDGFYTPVNYVGAFGAGNWAADWTALSQYGILTASGGYNPVPRPPSSGGGEAPILTAVREASGLRLTWTGGVAPFKVLRRAAVAGGGWVEVGTTSEPTFQVPVEGAEGYFRVESAQ